MSLFTHPRNVLFLFILFFASGYGTHFDKVFILPSFDHGGGVFHNFMNVIGFLDFCEENKIKNFEVDFGEKGHYYEKDLGPNWWNYYFQPIDQKSLLVKVLLGFKRTKKRISSDKMANFVKKVEFEMSRDRAYELIQKYIHLKDELQNEVDAFTNAHFSDHYIIGIHYRGTDKIHKIEGYAQTEATMISYEEIFRKVDEVIVRQKKGQFRLFVATDSQDFLDVICSRYPALVVYAPAIRSQDGKPLHYKVNDAPPLYYYQQGKEAVVDCVLLSKCDFLIKTSSNLNYCSSLFNPRLETISLNQRL